MIPLADAQARVFARCARLPEAVVPLDRAVGLIVAEPITTAQAVPPFANSAMDGFAVQAADTAAADEARPVRLKIAGTVAAGAVSEAAVQPGAAVRIMTGAPIPEGADAIAIVEVCRPASDGTEVEITAPAQPGDHIRPAGDDLRSGDVVVAAGTELSIGHLGVLAGIGRTEVKVIQRARVGVMSTGDELVEGPQPLRPGQIRDANRATLLALLSEAGCEPVDLGIIPDDEAAIADAVTTGIAECDALITSGGVSMGDFDYVKAVLNDLGDMEWMQIAIRPAKPLAFGTVAAKPVFGLPGNPVSAMVSFELFARPALRQMMGRAGSGRLVVQAVADEGLPRRRDGKTHFVRVVTSYGADGQFHVASSGSQGSHQLSAMAAANSLAVVPDGDAVPPGEMVEVMILGPVA